MSWANIKELLFQERKILTPSPLPDLPQETAFESQHNALLACYLNSKSQVDDAVRTFADTLEWPALTPVEKFFVVARLEFAWEIASILNTARADESFIPYPSPQACTTGELLEWLLIDIWPYGCGRFLQTQKWLAQQATIPRRELAHRSTEALRLKRVA